MVVPRPAQEPDRHEDRRLVPAIRRVGPPDQRAGQDPAGGACPRPS